MTTAMLTPQANQAPAVAKVDKELSGKVWTSRFLGSILTADLTADFRICVDGFIAAIKAGGGHHDISSTYRPPKRAYLMHWAHEIYRNGFDPEEVPSMKGVEIEWSHATLEDSVAAARSMVNSFQIAKLAANTAPALDSLHTIREAIDMRIWGEGDLVIGDFDGTEVTIDTEPRTGMNRQLKAVGKTYGVIKFKGGAADKPHWSTTGH